MYHAVIINNNREMLDTIIDHMVKQGWHTNKWFRYKVALVGALTLDQEIKEIYNDSPETVNLEDYTREAIIISFKEFCSIYNYKQNTRECMIDVSNNTFAKVAVFNLLKSNNFKHVLNSDFENTKFIYMNFDNKKFSSCLGEEKYTKISLDELFNLFSTKSIILSKGLATIEDDKINLHPNQLNQITIEDLNKLYLTINNGVV